MPIRHAAVAGSFYPREEAACRAAVIACVHAAEELAEKTAHTAGGLTTVRVGVVPHAGWIFSGATAARTMLEVSRSSPPPSTVVLCGAVHVPGVRRPALYTTDEGAWWTPLGSVPIDAVLARTLRRVAVGLLEVDPEAHEGEHSLEVQVPLLHHLLPDARIVPIAVPPSSDALHLGAALGRVLAERRDVAVLASSDLTHYGPRYRFTPRGRGAQALAWVKDHNDAEIIDAMTALDPGRVLAHARAHQSACGAGAIATALSAARVLGATRGERLAYTTSADVRPDLGGEDFVGYASVAVSCPR